MNKLIIFDLDGVLIDSKDIHFDALNKALGDLSPEFRISKEDHLKFFDGLPTKDKLESLSKERNLSVSLHEDIFIKKQRYTYHQFSQLQLDEFLQKVFKLIKDKSIQIAIASNCIRKSVQIALCKIGIIEYVDFIISSDDVFRRKPSPECYWRCMIACNSIPSNTVIFEDSYVGQQAAKNSKAHLIPIKNRKALDADLINKAFNLLEIEQSIPWEDPKMNVLIPMAGEGTRLTRSMRDQVEDQVDKDMQAEYKAYHIATWEPGQLLPAFANHRKVLNEISSKSAEKEFRTTFAI